MLEQLIKFAELGNQHKIIYSTPSGKPTECQGWIMEINENALLISTGFCNKQSQDIWLSFDQLKNAQLFYWDIQSNQWIKFK